MIRSAAEDSWFFRSGDAVSCRFEAYAPGALPRWEPTVIIDRYGHLFPDAVDTLTPKLDAVGREAQSG